PSHSITAAEGAPALQRGPRGTDRSRQRVFPARPAALHCSTPVILSAPDGQLQPPLFHRVAKRDTVTKTNAPRERTDEQTTTTIRNDLRMSKDHAPGHRGAGQG